MLIKEGSLRHYQPSNEGAETCSTRKQPLPPSPGVPRIAPPRGLAHPSSPPHARSSLPSAGGESERGGRGGKHMRRSKVGP